MRCQFAEEDRLRSLFRSHYLKGFDFHQTAAKNNPESMDWVLRKGYLDYKPTDIRI